MLVKGQRSCFIANVGKERIEIQKGETKEIADDTVAEALAMGWVIPTDKKEEKKVEVNTRS